MKGLILALLLLPGAAFGQFPSKPITILVGFAPGGASDVVTRVLAQGLSQQLNGHPVVVENRPGAESSIAADAVRKSAPDGHTILMGTNSAMVAVPTLRPNPPYDPFADFTPIANFGRFTMFLVVGPGVPAKSVKEFIDYARTRQGELNYASSNSAALLAATQLLMSSGLKMTHVPYKGDPQAITDMMSGQIHMMFTTGTTAPPLVREGKLKALATLLTERSPLLPEVPVAAEAGLQSLTIVPWAAFFGPARMPPEVVAKLNREVVAALGRPEVREQMARQGFSPTASTPQELAGFFRQQHEAWGKTVKEAGIKFE